MSSDRYDVAIIGGRCAGVSLALRLANQNLRILLVDRATFPSGPSVPSSPFVHPGTMRLLDELGIAESDYTLPGAKIERFMANYIGYFQAELPTTLLGLDRNYFQGIDRRHFDSALWEHAKRAPGVTALEGTAVAHVLKDESGRVTGISAKSAESAPQTFLADLVVGADGRFSFAAREFGAKTVEERNEFTTATYHAEWENMDGYSPDHPNAITNYNTGKSFMLLAIPIAERKYIVATYMRSKDAHFGGKGAEQAYLEGLQRSPHLMDRLKNARRVTDVVGIRPIENGYREAFGTNWALVGDAVHYKDPADGQGIYDALMGSKLLAESILNWKQRGQSWSEAGAAYQKRLMDETHAMFKYTVANVKMTVYSQPPPFIIKTLMRYMLNDPAFQTRLLRNLGRAIHPDKFKMTPGLILGILMRGIASDVRKRPRSN